MTQHRSQMECRLANTDDGRQRDAARCLEAGVIETGNDVRGNLERIALGDFGQKSRH